MSVAPCSCKACAPQYANQVDFIEETIGKISRYNLNDTFSFSRWRLGRLIRWTRQLEKRREQLLAKVAELEARPASVLNIMLPSAQDAQPGRVWNVKNDSGAAVTITTADAPKPEPGIAPFVPGAPPAFSRRNQIYHHVNSAIHEHASHIVLKPVLAGSIMERLEKAGLV